ncbi:hypothetical protein EYF80_037459 [Liparis tanakae]|uniref:Uncharacterized protein n=1 Tax=Liparis tanakae TaxID=230148 RepID=A0A4Z2GGP4_9TELE|nr:hypothetical protein EYF80_037459 [Liparis tanakae]
MRLILRMGLPGPLRGEPMLFLRSLLPPQLLLGHLVHVEDRVLPLDLLHAVSVVGHVLADADLAQGVPVAPVGAFELLHQVRQRAELQRLEHEVVPPADAQRAEAAAAVDAQHDVVEVVP